jgi:hypothetical protein
MSRFFGYSHYYALQRRSAEEDRHAAADETGVPGRTLLLLGFLAVSGGIAVCLALAS